MLAEADGAWVFRTAPDLAGRLRPATVPPRHLPQVAVEELVFSQFVAAPFGAEAIARAAKPQGPLLLTGGTSTAARDDAVALFASNPSRQVLVASLRAGGVGLNLTAASVVFHFDRW